MRKQSTVNCNYDIIDDLMILIVFFSVVESVQWCKENLNSWRDSQLDVCRCTKVYGTDYISQLVMVGPISNHSVHVFLVENPRTFCASWCGSHGASYTSQCSDCQEKSLTSGALKFVLVFYSVVFYSANFIHLKMLDSDPPHKRPPFLHWQSGLLLGVVFVEGGIVLIVQSCMYWYIM
jgi:hypothetical protein